MQIMKPLGLIMCTSRLHYETVAAVSTVLPPSLIRPHANVHLLWGDLAPRLEGKSGVLMRTLVQIISTIPHSLHVEGNYDTNLSDSAEEMSKEMIIEAGSSRF